MKLLELLAKVQEWLKIGLDALRKLLLIGKKADEAIDEVEEELKGEEGEGEGEAEGPPSRRGRQ